MAEPLTPLSGNALNSRTPFTGTSAKASAASATHGRTQIHLADEAAFSSDLVAPSSPFLYEAERSSRSPTKSFSPSKSATKSRSPQKLALNDARRPYPLTEESLRANEVSLETPRASQIKNNPTNRNYSPSESCLSAFSAIPNVDMTMFAKLGLSPSKSSSKRGSQDESSASPSRSRPRTPGTVRAQNSQGPGHSSSPDAEDGTIQLMDFTEQLDFAAQSNRSPIRTRNSPSKDSRDAQYRPHRDQAGFKPVPSSQARELTNLLDFDLPPAPTPRSIPTISARELESLKAGLLSQISALKATLAGKDAEVTALKAAAGDAETRVGDGLEQLREMRNVMESLEHEKKDWDRRDQETQRVLREVRAQIHETEQERAQMETRLAEAERRAEDADERAQAAESQVSSAAAGVEAANEMGDGDLATPGSGANKAVQIAVEKVARELHTLYKAKHETKVAQLKKSYEARWSKKTNALQAEVERLDKELQESRMEVEGLRHELEENKLKSGRVDAMTTIDPGKLAELESKERAMSQLQQEMAKLKEDLEKTRTEKEAIEYRADELASGAVTDSARTKEFEAKIHTMSIENDGLKGTTLQLAQNLQKAREENAELVATVDEFLAMDFDATTSIKPAPDAQPEKRPASSHSNSISRPGSALSGHVESGHAKPSGLKGPGTFGFSQSRIGMGGPAMKRNISGSRGGILSNIEKMGRPRGADH